MKKTAWGSVIFVFTLLVTSALLWLPQASGGGPKDEVEGKSEPSATTRLGANVVCARTLKASVVAFEQVTIYNRFGAFNPVGMLYALRRDVVAIDGQSPGPGNARLRPDKRPRPLVLRANVGDCLDVHFTNWLNPNRPGGDAPATRHASFHVEGLAPRDIGADGSHVGRNPSSLVAPGGSTTYRFYAMAEGTFLARDLASPAGGEGDGGATALGLFGAVHVEPAGARWYRSQVSGEEMSHAVIGRNPDGTPRLKWDARHPITGDPILEILSGTEIVHSDLDAIITGYERTDYGDPSSPMHLFFREFTIVFHDELKVVQAFPELEQGTLLAVRDAFGVNYGASGLGSALLANRKKIGPAAGCVECKFEEFFLSSWTNGDPGLLVEHDGSGKAVSASFPGDPSTVAHSYVGDPVRIRNLHAGPKETHVFHLHGHQWLMNGASETSGYLDSQSIGPGVGFTYDITYGGGGNRNLTPGDAIFHCHLYPHFSQGMWGLWRNHDTFEEGTPDRNLPDGEIAQGIPTPAVVPIPGKAMAPMPTYGPTRVADESGRSVNRPPMPGYPHYIAAQAGHRAPQPPMDLMRDGGLPRHRVEMVHEQRPDPDPVHPPEILAADIRELPLSGTTLERSSMDYHAGRFPAARRLRTSYGIDAAAYPGYTPEGQGGLFIVNGLAPKPGAPWADPCPAGAPQRTFQASYIQMDLITNREGWHDPQARLIVLDQDVERTLSGERPPEPFFVRVNSGDCISFLATNRMPGQLEEDDFQIKAPTDTVGQHIHLVKFDLMASDGSSNGWNYEDGTFAADEVVARIEAANATGGIIDEAGKRRRLTATRSPGLPDGAQTTIQRWWADPLVNSKGADRTMRTVFTHDHLSPSAHQQHGFYGGIVVEPPGSRWRDPETGEFFGTRWDGGPTSWRADIVLPGTGAGSYREFNLAFADFALLYDAHGEPINPPTFKEAALPIAIEHPQGLRQPEAISNGDPGSMLINYAHEPIPLRIARKTGGSWRLKQGEHGLIHNVFRSDLHGDPFTPVMRGYEGDQIRINLIQGAQEEQHVFAIHGQSWLRDDADEDSGLVAGQGIGISEHMEFTLSGGLQAVKSPFGTADYLYKSAPSDDLWNGMWGIMRAYGTWQSDLLPLPNSDLRPATKAIQACPTAAPKRKYTVHAIAAKGNLPGGRLTYNERFGLFDPDALLFVRAEHLADVRKGKRRAEPLILRARAGDCVVVTLVNELPTTPQKTPHFNYGPPITEGFNFNQVPMSNRVSLHPQLVTYDVNLSDGARVGFNLEQDAARGKRITYEWYAGKYDIANRSGNLRAGTPVELGAINLVSMSDVVNHPTHGLIGALIIEPLGATWVEDPGTAAQANVTYKGVDGKATSFREFVLIMQNDVPLHSDRSIWQCRDQSMNCGTALRNIGGADDAEMSGHVAFNYRTEPFWARLGIKPEDTVREEGGEGHPEDDHPDDGHPDDGHPDDGHVPGVGDADLQNILASTPFDPETPLLTAKAGEAIRLRVLLPWGHPRQHAFSLHGHAWSGFPFDQGTSSGRMGGQPRGHTVSTQGVIGPMTAWNVIPFGGAGGPLQVPGDWLYRDQASFLFSDGLWGILRVRP